jgi:methyl-accepting chemotaxis protein
MFSNVSIRARLLFLVAVSAAVVVGLSAASVYSTRQQLGALESVYEHQMQPVAALSHIDSDLKEIRFRIAGVLLDQMPTTGSINHLKEARTSIADQWSVFRKKTEGHQSGGEEQTLVGKIEKSLAELPAFLDKVGAAYAKNDKKSLESLLEEGWPVVHMGLVKPLQQLLPMRERAVKATYETSVEQGTHLLELQGALALFGLLVVTALALMAARRINRGLADLKASLQRVQQGDLQEVMIDGSSDELGEIAGLLQSTVSHLRQLVGQVKGSADELSGHSAQLLREAGVAAERAASQSDSIMHVGANMEQNAVAIAEVSQNAGAVAEAATHAGVVAVQCKENMAQSLTAGQRIVDAVEQSSATIAKVSESVDRVGEITGIIKEIAEQTNLLALNAAIEAARAGEHGRGFAVVSDEVRRLAERTAQSTSDITATVEAIRSVVENAVASIRLISEEVKAETALSHTTDETLQKIVTAGEGLSKMAEQIAVAVKQQSAASEDVTRTIEKLSSLTEENSHGVQEVDGTAKSVAATAARMTELVGQFKLSA